MSFIRLDPKYGVNPSVVRCFLCGEAYGVALLGRLPDGGEAPCEAVYERTPCDKCQVYMRQGIIIIQTRNGETGDNPYRLGGFAVLTEAAVRRIVRPEELLAHILQTRVAFIDDETWQALGLAARCATPADVSAAQQVV
jgi:hypothetical protein